MSTRELRLPLTSDLTLEALLDEPSAPTQRAALVCAPHPAFGGRMSSPLVEALAGGLAAAGWTTLRFHYRGIEGSDGVATGGLAEHEDVLAAHRFLREGYAQVAWVGYSFGALMSLRVLSQGLPSTYVGVALPTDVIGDDPLRIAEVAIALASGVPALFIAGEDDPICRLGLVREFCTGVAHATVEGLAGEGHIFSYIGTRAVVDRARRWLEAAHPG